MREVARPTWPARRNNLFKSTMTPNLRSRGTCRKISSTNVFRWRIGDDIKTRSGAFGLCLGPIVRKSLAIVFEMWLEWTDGFDLSQIQSIGEYNCKNKSFD